MSGGAVAKASKILLNRVLKIGAHLLGTQADNIVLKGSSLFYGDQSISIANIADAWYISPQRLPPDADPAGLETTVGYKPRVDTGCFTYATHAAVVAVDPDLGSVEILDYVCVEDCGVMVNPMVVEGQTIGGIVQGIGTAMFEETPYDNYAQPLASTFADYMIPGASESPKIRVDHFETPSPHTEFGAKGMGEGGAIAPPAVIFGAINDALRVLGATELSDTPVTPRKILSAIHHTNVNTESSVRSRS
jgi:carbon-monoxide dehydrogenase large subunit